MILERNDTMGCVKLFANILTMQGLSQFLRPANESRRYKLMPSLIGWAQT